jgi:hypothetical protein
VPAILAQWDFNSITPDGDTTTGTTAAKVGTGTLTAVGGVSQTFFSGSSADPATADNSAFAVLTFPAQSTANKTAGIEIAVDTTGFGNVILTFDHRSSSTASGRAAVQYSTDGGTTWTDATMLTVSSTDWSVARTVNLSSVAGVADNANLKLRVVSAFDGSEYVGTTNPYATEGTWRFDMITVTGDATAGIEAPLSVATRVDAAYVFAPGEIAVSDSDADQVVLIVYANGGQLRLPDGSLNASVSYSGTVADVNLLLSDPTEPFLYTPVVFVPPAMYTGPASLLLELYNADALGTPIGTPVSRTVNAVVTPASVVSLAESLPPVYVRVGAPDGTIDLTPVFFPPEDVVRFEVASSDTAVVQAAVSGSDLILSYSAAGTATVTVTAFDRNESSVITTFAVGVVEDSTVFAVGPSEVGVDADFTVTLYPETEDLVDWTVYWGDGSMTTLTGVSGQVAVTHRYLEDGVFAISATAAYTGGGLFGRIIPLVVRAFVQTEPKLWTIRSQPERDKILEGAAGDKNVEFVIRSRIRPPAGFKVDWTTFDGSATAGADYTADSGTLEFDGTEFEKRVTVKVKGDINVEADEEFYVVLKLHPFVNGKPTLLNPVGRGKIQNDDFPDGHMDDWSGWVTEWNTMERELSKPYYEPGTG